LIIARYPEPKPKADWEDAVVSRFNLVMDVVRSIRNMRAEKKVTPGKRIPPTLVGGEQAGILKQQSAAIAVLAHLDPAEMKILPSLAEKPQGQASLVVSGVEIYLPLADLVDIDAERLRLQKELDEAESQIARLETLLGGDFAKKAPAPLVEKERQKLETFRENALKLRRQLES